MHDLLKRLSLIAGVVLAAAGAARAQAPAAPAAQPTLAPADFLARNAKESEVRVLPSGLQYKVLKAGDPKSGSPKRGDVIKVHYEGTLTNGQVFDSSFARNKPMLMQLGGLVPAWMEALPMMHTGDEWMLYVPPALGYGERAAGPIPPNSVLVFRLQLLGFLSAD